MKKPIIGIVANVMTIDHGLTIGAERAYLNQDYINAVLKVGGIPIILPVVDDLTIIEEQISFCDGIIISGGQDIHPKFYGENQHKKLGEVDSDVDRYQLELAQIAIFKDMPLLGICRGMQLINVASGGTLYQDLSEKSDDILKHLQSGKRYDICHNIRIEEGSILYAVFGSSTKVNSYHHQAVKDLGEGLSITAVADDGIVEGIEMKGKKFVVGVQWHPEMMIAGGSEMEGFFKRFVESINN